MSKSAGTYKIDVKISQDILKYLREKKKMAMEKIAKIAGVSRSTLYRIANGKTSFTVKQVIRLEKNMEENLLLAILKPPPKNAPAWQKKIYITLRKLLKLDVKKKHKPKAER